MPAATGRLSYIVDFQLDFVLRKGALPVPEAEWLIPVMNSYLRTITMDRYDRVVFSFDSHELPGYLDSLEHKGQPELGIPGFPPHCIIGTPGWMLAADHNLIPKGVLKYEVRKDVFDVWAAKNAMVRYFTGMVDTVETAAVPVNKFFDPGWHFQSFRTVEISGVASDYCVRQAIQGFLDRKFQVEVVTNLTAGISRNIFEVCEQEWPDHPLLKLVEFDTRTRTIVPIS